MLWSSHQVRTSPWSFARSTRGQVVAFDLTVQHCHVAILGYTYPNFWGLQDTGWAGLCSKSSLADALRRVDVHNSFELVCVESGGQRTKPQRISWICTVVQCYYHSQMDSKNCCLGKSVTHQIPSNPMVCHEFPNSMATEIITVFPQHTILGYPGYWLSVRPNSIGLRVS